MKPSCLVPAKYEKEGEAFRIIGRVQRSLIQSGQTEKEEEFTAKVLKTNSFKEVLQLIPKYVKVTLI